MLHIMVLLLTSLMALIRPALPLLIPAAVCGAESDADGLVVTEWYLDSFTMHN
jgi:hypothetical protein